MPLVNVKSSLESSVSWPVSKPSLVPAVERNSSTKVTHCPQVKGTVGVRKHTAARPFHKLQSSPIIDRRTHYEITIAKFQPHRLVLHRYANTLQSAGPGPSQTVASPPWYSRTSVCRGTAGYIAVYRANSIEGASVERTPSTRRLSSWGFPPRSPASLRSKTSPYDTSPLLTTWSEAKPGVWGEPPGNYHPVVSPLENASIQNAGWPSTIPTHAHAWETPSLCMQRCGAREWRRRVI